MTATRPHGDAQPVSAPEPSGAWIAGSGVDHFIAAVVRDATTFRQQAEEDYDADTEALTARAEAAEAEVERLQRSLENHERWRSLWEERAEAESARLASVVEALVKESRLALMLDTNTGEHVVPITDLRAALASVGVSGSADDRREANASQAPDTATPGEVPPECLTHAHIPWNNWCTPASSADDKAGECTACGHEHSPNLGGICVGCPCEEGGWR